jgi:putative spermidine/putrescine transport system substrate-binding protein
MRGLRGVVCVVVTVALAVPVAGVSSGSSGPALETLGKPEGKLSLLQWPGYSDPSFAKSFERSTGCVITRQQAVSSADMVRAMRSGRFDLVSASGDVSGTLISKRLVKPVNVALVPSWRRIAPEFRSPGYNTVKGVHYGVTVLWTPNALLYNTQRAKPAPVTWRAIYDDRFRGRVSIPDNPMQIADAALYLAATEPALHIRDPYELTHPQFDAAVALLRRQRPLVERYWQYATEQIQDFRTGRAVVGSSWPYQAQVLQASNAPARELVPRHGATAWADSWLLGAKAQHPNCAYRWLEYVLTAPAQATQALALRESPVNRAACRLMNAAEQGLCTAYYGASPPRLLRRLAFWKTPVARCGYGGRTDCVSYDAWRRAWVKIRS